MGAYDYFSGSTQCSRCGASQSVDGQLDFFWPDFYLLEQRMFAVGLVQPIRFRVSELFLAQMWDLQWWRVSVRTLDGEIRILLPEPDPCQNSSCTACAVVLRFVVSDELPPIEAQITAGQEPGQRRDGAG